MHPSPTPAERHKGGSGPTVEKKWKRLARQEVGANSIYKELKAREKLLQTEPVFIRDTERIKRSLEKAHADYPEEVTRFFRLFSAPSPSRLGRIESFLKRVFTEQVRRTLRSYVQYAARYQVRIMLCKKKPYFREKVQLSFGPKFHVKVAGGHIQPLVLVPPDEDFRPFLESENISVLPPVQQLLDTNHARFVRIEDMEGSSALSELEGFAYDPERITIVEHVADQNYLFCLFGEKVKKEVIREVAKVVTAYQKLIPGRGKAGRPPDNPRMRKTHALFKKTGRMKEKAAQVDKGNISSSQTYISRIKRKLDV
jgi:hypothetical protein